MKRLFLSVCLALLMAFSSIQVEAHQHCGKVWVAGHYSRYGRWVPSHWHSRHWVPGHYNHRGVWIHGHCR
jgi:hypothetical protein